MDLTLPPDFKEFLRLLNDNEVEYLLIGGYAVGTMDTHEQPGIWMCGLQSVQRMQSG